MPFEVDHCELTTFPFATTAETQISLRGTLPPWVAIMPQV
jgi:hypothetical protein